MARRHWRATSLAITTVGPRIDNGEAKAEPQPGGLVAHFDSPNPLAAGARHGAVAFDVANDAPGGVPNLEPPPVAGIVNIPDALAVRVRDCPACRGGRSRVGRRAAVLPTVIVATARRRRAGQDHGKSEQDQDGSHLMRSCSE